MNKVYQDAESAIEGLVDHETHRTFVIMCTHIDDGALEAWIGHRGHRQQNLTFQVRARLGFGIGHGFSGFLMAALKIYSDTRL